MWEGLGTSGAGHPGCCVAPQPVTCYGAYAVPDSGVVLLPFSDAVQVNREIWVGAAEVLQPTDTRAPPSMNGRDRPWRPMLMEVVAADVACNGAPVAGRWGPATGPETAVFAPIWVRPSPLPQRVGAVRAAPDRWRLTWDACGRHGPAGPRTHAVLPPGRIGGMGRPLDRGRRARRGPVPLDRDATGQRNCPDLPGGAGRQPRHRYVHRRSSGARPARLSPGDGAVTLGASAVHAIATAP